MVVAVLTAIGASSDPVCTAGAPCGGQWLDATGTMLFLPYVLFLLVLPELVLVLTPLLLAYVAEPSNWHGGTALRAADVVIIATLCWGAAGAFARLRARRRQRAFLLDAAGGVTAVAPRTADRSERLRRGFLRCVLGTLMCLAGAGVLTSVVLDNRADDRTARSAAVHDVPVVAYSSDDYALTVRLPDGSRHRFDVIGDYRGVHEVRVRESGSWLRLAAEPYGDRSTRQLVGFTLATLGFTLVASGLFVRARRAQLYGGPVPVLRVLAREVIKDHYDEERTEVLPHDDPAGLHPILHFTPYPGYPVRPGRLPSTRGPLREALLYGVVTQEAGELALAVATDEGPGRVERNDSPIGRGAADPNGDLDDAADPDHVSGDPRTAEERRAAEQQVQDALATMPPATGPVRWRAHLADRVAAGLFIVAGIGGLTVLTSEYVWWHAILLWLFVPTWLMPSFGIMTWRITATAAGLDVRRFLRSRHIPWPQARTAGYQGGELTLAVQSDPNIAGPAARVSIPVTGFVFLNRLLRRPAPGPRTAAEITALIGHPALRPAKG